MADTFADTAKLILQSRKNANLLIDLLEKLDSSSSNEILKLITCLETVFAGFFSERLWQRRPKSEEGLDDKVELEGDGRSSFSSKNIEKNKDNGEQKPGDEKDSEAASQKNAERVFADWAHSKYLHFVKTLLRLFSHEEKPVQKAALDCLMNFIVLEYNAKISSSFVSSKENYFPRTLFSRVIDHMLFSGQNAMKTQLKHFEGYLEFSDIQFYTLQNILRILNGKSKTISKNEALQNSLCSLLIHMTSQVADETTVGFVIEDEDRLQNIAAGSKRRKQLFSDTWISFLHLRLTSQCLKKILTNLHDKIMPQMQDPKLLIDFLTDSYNLEGSIAMLALNGLFLLIQNYNLDYPDFFKKLYNLLNADIFEVKYRDRFFALADLFLTSLNLPAYMAAAFIKRLARLSLRVSPDGIKIILVMIENLLKRHPSCKVLIHRKVKSDATSEEKPVSDPYKFDEPDPARCNALNSSLWELKTLEQHYCSDIQEAVKAFNQPFNRQEKDVSAYFESCYADLFNQELISLETEDSIPLNFKASSQIFNMSTYDDSFWAIE